MFSSSFSTSSPLRWNILHDFFVCEVSVVGGFPKSKIAVNRESALVFFKKVNIIDPYKVVLEVPECCEIAVRKSGKFELPPFGTLILKELRGD